MTKNRTLSRLQRLDELIGLLKSSDYHTAASLADQLAVSQRTLMRDLDVLKNKGFPIETGQGRGGGIRMHRHWGIGRLQLNYAEVIDLLLSLAIMEKIGSPIFLSNLRAVRHKISQSFPQAQRNQVQSLRKRLLIGELASDQVLASYPHKVKTSSESIYAAFFEMRQLNIAYQDGAGHKTSRTIEPHYLWLNWPVWYVLAWDNLRHDVRCFRLDRIANAQINTTGFRLKNIKLFMQGLEEFYSAL